MQYSNGPGFESGMFGKVIACMAEDTITLYGSMTSDEDGVSTIPDLFFAIGITDINKLVGNHADIDGVGIRLGGCSIMVSEDEVLMRDYSFAYGALHPDVVSRCLGGRKVRYRAANIGFGDGVPEEESWLAAAIDRAGGRAESDRMLDDAKERRKKFLSKDG